MINILIVDDQLIVRQGLKMIVENMNGMKVVGEAGNGKEAYEKCKWLKPDIVLMDIKMPEVDGVEATKRIKLAFHDINIIILTTFNDDEYIFEALKHGASGYLLKDAEPEKIEEAILEVKKGGALIQPNVAQKVVTRIQQLEKKKAGSNPKLKLLTERELEILRLIGVGKNNEEIALKLYISKGTVKNHISNMLIKLELRDRTQLAIIALKNDLV